MAKEHVAVRRLSATIDDIDVQMTYTDLLEKRLPHIGHSYGFSLVSVVESQ